jgi:hypothetical protein
MMRVDGRPLWCRTDRPLPDGFDLRILADLAVLCDEVGTMLPRGCDDDLIGGIAWKGLRHAADDPP